MMFGRRLKTIHHITIPKLSQLLVHIRKSHVREGIQHGNLLYLVHSLIYFYDFPYDTLTKKPFQCTCHIVQNILAESILYNIFKTVIKFEIRCL